MSPVVMEANLVAFDEGGFWESILCQSLVVGLESRQPWGLCAKGHALSAETMS